MKYFYTSILLLVFSITSLFSNTVFKMSFDDEQVGAFTEPMMLSKYPNINWIQLNGRGYITEDAQRGKVLTVHYPVGKFGPIDSGIQYLASITPAKSYYLDYFVKFNNDFHFNKGGKLPGLTSGGSEYTGGTQPNDGKGWSARYMWTNSTPALYLYYAEQSNQYGESFTISNSQFSTDVWHRLTQEIIVNDSDESNAEIRVWVDGYLMLEKKNFKLRTSSGNDGLIDSFYFSNFFGGNDETWAPWRDCTACFDEITVSSTPPAYLKELDQTQQINLDPTTTQRFASVAKQWGENFGDASVCLWKDDKVAAFSVTIDDNIESETDYWKEKQAIYGFPFTWFLITEAGSWPEYDAANSDSYNVKNWNKYIELAQLGNYIDCHDDRNWYNSPPTGKPNPDSLKYVTRLKKTRQKVDAEVGHTGNRALTYAYPFGEGNIDYARTQYIAFRGTLGLLNHANKVNYLNVNSVSSPHIAAAPATYIDPLLNKQSVLYGTNYYRGWGSTHFHGLYNDAAKTQAENLLQYLYDRKDSIWVDGFTAIAQYGQSRDTHTLTVNSTHDSEIKFTLTDEMSDELFYHPLTVKIRVNNDWANVTAVQNDNQLDAMLITHAGNKYALVNAIPDRGQVTVTAETDADPAIITVDSDVSIAANATKTVNFSASTNQSSTITFSFENLPSFVTTTVQDNSGSFTISPKVADVGKHTFSLLANNGRSTMSKSIQITVTADINTLIIHADKADAAVYYPEHSFVDTNNRDNIIAGGGYVENKQMSAVFPFLLPPSPEGKVLKSASFQAYLESINDPSLVTGHLDVYTLNPRTSPVVLVTDGYAGSFGSTSEATAIQENFADKNTPVGVVSMSQTGEQSLTQYLKSLFDTQQAGKYVFIRLSNSNTTQTRSARMFFTTADGAENVQIDSRYPSLILNFENDTSSAVNKLSLKSYLQAYPNPMNGASTLHITLPKTLQNNELVVEVWNLTGVLCYTNTHHADSDIQINMQGLNNQMYILKCISNNQIFQSKIIK